MESESVNIYTMNKVKLQSEGIGDLLDILDTIPIPSQHKSIL